MPTVIRTSPEKTSTGYFNQKRVARTSNGVLWTFFRVGGYISPNYSTDGGVTWAESSALNTAFSNGSFFIDLDDNLHVVYKNSTDGFIYYRRATPDTARTAWTWSAAMVLFDNTWGSVAYVDHPDLVVHRNGSGWTAHVVVSYNENTLDRTWYTCVDIASNGTATHNTSVRVAIGGPYSNTLHKYPSIDFHHNGDGKTVKKSPSSGLPAPHLYVAWTAGAAGAGKGLRYKAAFWAGSLSVWQWQPEREIDNTVYVHSPDNAWFNCMFDGTRIVMAGVLYTGSGYSNFIHERNDADTVTTNRTTVLAEGNVYSGSATYDHQGNVYTIGRESGGSNGAHQLKARKWDRATDTVTENVLIENSTHDNIYVSARKGFTGDRLDFIYTDGMSADYQVKYSYVGDTPEEYPEFITTSTAATATAYSNQRKIDRTSNGVLWASYDAGASDIVFKKSEDNGTTWTAGGDIWRDGSATRNYTPNHSFFIDQDDYAHLVYKNHFDGHIYYRRGTPNAGRTAWTWSAATQLNSTSDNYPDVVAHREGTGWRVHVVFSQVFSNTTFAGYIPLTVTSGGTITKGSLTWLDGGNGYASTVGSYPSIDFNHTGDGKTVAGGTPHLYVAWSTGATGAGKGIRFKKATYSGGTWTWGADREIDPNHSIAGVGTWVNCIFDGTAVMIVGFCGGVTTNNFIFERNAADTTTTQQLMSSLTLQYGSATFDHNRNIVVVAQIGTTAIRHWRWRRSDGTSSYWVIGVPGNSALYSSIGRGSLNRKQVDVVQTDGGSSPYSVMYYKIDRNNKPNVPTIESVQWANGLLEVDYTHSDLDSDPQAKRQFRYREVNA